MANAFKFEGGKELEAALKRIGEDTGKSTAGKGIVRRALTQAAKPFAERWQALAPKATGQYEQSIHIGTKLTKRQARMARKVGKSSVEIYVGTSDPAGVQLEFGNSRQAAQPSGRPAWDEEQDGVLKTLGVKMWLEIEKRALRLARKAAKLK